MDDKSIINIKKRIENLINQNFCDEAISLLDQLMNILPEDMDVYSMYSVALLMQGKLEEAEKLCNRGLDLDYFNFDLNYNLAYIKESKGEYSKSVTFYNQAITSCDDEEMKSQIKEAIGNIETNFKVEAAKKIVFFVKRGLDSFLSDIINFMSTEYIVKKVVVENFEQIDVGMNWADICWFEWCDELITYGSNSELAQNKKIICRLHRYETFTEFPSKVDWNRVDKLIIVAEHLKDLLKAQVPDIEEMVDIIHINNGVDINKFNLISRNKGYNLAYVGYIHPRKNPYLLLQIIAKLASMDKRYKLYVAGKFQDSLVELYWKYQVKEMGLENNVVFDGWQSDISAWLSDKNYILSTSIHESFGYGIAEAMCRGIKPIIHNFVFSEGIWDRKYLFNTIDEAVAQIRDKKYNSLEYRNYIESNYSLAIQESKTKELLNGIYEEKYEDKYIEKLNKFTLGNVISCVNDFNLYSCDEIERYNFDSARIYMGKREVANESIDIIEFIITNNEKKKLVITGGMYHKETGQLEFSEVIMKSNKYNEICKLAKCILNDNYNFGNSNLKGYIYDEDRIEDVKENSIIYSWERAIPATHFMPILGYRNIIARYYIASKYLKDNYNVLEAACGYGYGAAYMSNKCSQIHAVDLAEDNILFSKECYSKNNINWKVGDVLKLPYEDNKFDIYTSFETLEHLDVDKINQYFVEGKRVLKSDGKMIISTPNKTNRLGINNPYHIKEYTEEELDKILTSHFKYIVYYSLDDKGILNHGVSLKAVNIIAVCSDEEIEDPYKKYLLKKFNKNVDDMDNTEELFEYLINSGYNKEYMENNSRWFINSNYDTTSKMNFYYSNLYRNFKNYDRFKHIDQPCYDAMNKMSIEIADLYDVKILENNNKKIVLFSSGIDIKQTVNKFVFELSKYGNSGYEFTIISTCAKEEFVLDKTVNEIIKKYNIEVFIPNSFEVVARSKEIIEYIEEIKPSYVIYQTLYFAPTSILLLESLRRMNLKVGAFILQQPEKYFHEKLDFVVSFGFDYPDVVFKNDCREYVPVDSNKINNKLDIKDDLNIEKDKFVIISIGRSIKYNDEGFWNYVNRCAKNIENICFVFYGVIYEDYAKWIDERLVNEGKIIIIKFSVNASNYLMSCNAFLNSHLSGGIALSEAYYSELPIITGYQRNIEKCSDLEGVSHMYPSRFFKDNDIYPTNWDYESIYKFTCNLVNDIQFRNNVLKVRKFPKENLTYEYFSLKLINFLESKIK